MFNWLKERWAESRATRVASEVAGILSRLPNMPPDEQRLVSSAFSAGLTELEEKMGPLAGWTLEQKASITQTLRRATRHSLNRGGSNIHAQTKRITAHGSALLSLYVELQDLPHKEARATLKKVEDWRAVCLQR